MAQNIAGHIPRLEFVYNISVLQLPGFNLATTYGLVFPVCYMSEMYTVVMH